MALGKRSNKGAVKAELYSKAQKFMQKGQWAKALDQMIQAHNTDKSDPMVTLRIGDLYKKMNKDADAANFYFKTANIFADQGHTTKAAATYKMILRIDPSLAEVQEKLDALAASRSETSSTKITPVSPSPGTGSMEVSHSPSGGGGIDVSPPMEDAPPIEHTHGGGDSPPIELSQDAGDTQPIDDSSPFIQGPMYDSEPQYDNSGTDIKVNLAESSADSSYGDIELAGAHNFVPGGPVITDSAPGDFSFGDGPEFEIERTSGEDTPATEPGFDPELDEGLIGGTTFGVEGSPGSDTFTDFAADIDAPSGEVPAIDISDPPKHRESELFLGIEEQDLWELLGRMDRLTFGPGEDIIREGDSGDSIYIISDGRVSVSTSIKGNIVKLAELGEQDFFGEVSFLTRMPRTATVTALDTTTILELKRSEVDDLIDKNPEVASVLMMFHKNRVADTLSTIKTMSKGFF